MQKTIDIPSPNCAVEIKARLHQRLCGMFGDMHCAGITLAIHDDGQHVRMTLEGYNATDTNQLILTALIYAVGYADAKHEGK